MLKSDTQKYIEAYYSPWKVAIGEFFLLSLCVIPLLPGMKGKVTIFRPLYEGGLFIVVIIASGILGILFIAHMPILLRAIKSKPAICIAGERVFFYKIGLRSFDKADVESVSGSESSGLVVKLKGGKRVDLPLFLYKFPKRSLEEIAKSLDVDLIRNG